MKSCANPPIVTPNETGRMLSAVSGARKGKPYLSLGTHKRAGKPQKKHTPRDPVAWSRRLANLKTRWPTQTLEQRFWSHVDKSGTCWPWTAYCHPTGYGIFNLRKGRWMYAHRMAYELAKGPIPYDKFVCHTCDTPPCCNPAHLWPGTHQENMADMRKKGRGKSKRRTYATPSMP